MHVVEPRKYEQRARADTARQTRQRILDAVHDALRAAPSVPISVDAIATAASVTRPTIYSIFGSRAGLFSAAGAELLSRAGFADVLASSAHPDALEGMRHGFRGIITTYANERDVFRALYSTAHLDAASFGGAVEELERGRAIGMEQLARRLQSQGYLDDAISEATLADMLWILTSFESFDLLYTGRHLAIPEVAGRLISTAERLLRVPSQSLNNH